MEDQDHPLMRQQSACLITILIVIKRTMKKCQEVSVFSFQFQHFLVITVTSSLSCILQISKRKGKKFTPLNGIAFKCSSSNISITSSVGPWGNYGRDFICPSRDTYITQCQLRVESRQGAGDDTAANNLNCKCSNNDTLNGDGTEWGIWMAWSQPCSNGICGLQTRVERSQGSGDDTVINDVIFLGC
ncbi:vitelline membrane outer layer protein I-like protein [Daphnia sinensis]|uniref:Vitelline membrane outer layer protein I-like protein n=1 Tax=Daphnia sinensis TaxID=1820382 RepID=A0AAD5L8W8_9CRUS|nr:vitelline membrane outer layer protein I-like protein [Daphnia sinensis]